MDTDKAGSPRINRKREAQRARILAAATAEFSRRGYEQTTMQDIAAALGMTGAALYYYFKTKDILLYAAIDSVLESLLDALSGAAADCASDPPAALRRLVEAHITIELTEPAVGSLVNAHLYGPQYLVEMLTYRQRSQLRARQRAIYRCYREVVDAGIRTGDFVSDDASLLTFDLLALTQYPAVWYRPGGKLSVADVAGRQAEIATRMVGWNLP